VLSEDHPSNDPQAMVSVFRGPAVLIISEQGATRVRATAVTDTAAGHVTGVCDMTLTSVMTAQETCRFTIGARTVTSADQLDASAGPVWHRRYDDGASLDISAPSSGAVIPVPLPLGR
jgi:hypothetical protein